MTVSVEVLQKFVSRLHRIVSVSRTPETLDNVAALVAEALCDADIPVDRIQLPLSSLFGLKHPLYFGIILTWLRDKGSSAWLRPLQDGQKEAALTLLRKSPFGPLLSPDRSFVQYQLGTPECEGMPLLTQLYQDGFVAYAAIVVELPDGARQVVSIATRNAGGLSPEVIERLKVFSEPLSLALFSIYQTQLAQQIATTYLGQRTGSLVLEGRMGRGRSVSLRAGIAFIDIRDFTALSYKIGVKSILPLLNAVFEAIDDTLRPLGGEVLKLIGDAALVVFPLEKEANDRLVVFLRGLLDASDAAGEATEALGHRLRVGVGFHIGEVLYGNVGSRVRHDFTVMGSAVNLASRLENMTKSLSADMVISDDVAMACRRSCGGREGAERALKATVQNHDDVMVRGGPEPIRLWSLTRNRP